MRHSSSQFWLSLPAPENSQNFAIGFIGSKTQLSAQHGARSNSQSSLCALGQPHTSGPCPGAFLTSPTCSHEVCVGNYWALDGATKSLQPPCLGILYFWHLHGKSQNAQIHKLKQSPPFWWGKKKNPKNNKCIHFCLFVSIFLCMSLLCQGLQSQFFPSDFPAFPVCTNSSQTGSLWE